MSSRARFAVLAVVLAAGGSVAGVLSRSGDRPAGTVGIPLTGRTPSQPLPATCLDLPPRAAAPSWLPADLPMPPGSYVSDVPEASRGLRRVVFATNASLVDFVRHALKAWPAQGWQLGRGEAEPGEAEDNFLKGNRYGVFRARSVYCEEDWTQVLLVLNDPAYSPTPSPS